MGKYIVVVSLTNLLMCLTAARAERRKEGVDNRAIEEALWLGMDYMIRSAMVQENFDEYDSDYLFFFADVSRMSDPWISQRALSIGQSLGEYYLENGFSTSCADSIVDAVSALWALELLGMDVDAPLAVLQLEAKSFGVNDYLGFERIGGRPDTDLLIDLLIGLHFTDQMGVDVGITYAEVIPYVNHVDYHMDPMEESDRFIDTNNLVTHLVYTLSGYASWSLDVRFLEREKGFIRRYFAFVMWWADPESLSEYIDSLKLMGFGDQDGQISAGIKLLLAIQKPDGRWEPDDVEDEYDRYHATWCAMDALRSYDMLEKQGLADPAGKWMLQQWHANPHGM